MRKTKRWLIKEYFDYMVHKKNNNVFAAFVGKTGSGKTYSSLSLAEAIDETFDEKRIVFDVKSCRIILSELIRSGDSKGKVVLYEEAGVSIGHLDYAKQEVKDFNFILQTVRASNIHILFTAPDLSLISKASRGLFKAIFRMKYIDRTRNVCVASASRYEWNPKKNSLDLRPLAFQGNRIITTSFPLPSKRIRDCYERKKQLFLLSLLERNDFRPELTSRQREVLDLHREGLSGRAIGERLGISERVSFFHLAAIKKKGYEV